MKRRFSLWTFKDDDNDKFLLSKISVSDFLLNLVNDFRTGKLIQSKNLDLQRKKLEVDIRYKEIMIKIKEKELNFSETFDKTPSSQAKTAIKVAVDTQGYEPPEEKKIKEMIENNWNRFVETLKQNPKGEWIATCKLCSTGFILPTQATAIMRFKQHLEQTHYEKVLD